MIFRNRELGIEKAFELLEQAAKEKEQQLRSTRSQFSPLMDNLISDAFQKMNQSIDGVESIIKEGGQISHSVFLRLQKDLERDPWKFLGKVALTSWGMGLMLGAYFRKRSRSKK